MEDDSNTTYHRRPPPPCDDNDEYNEKLLWDELNHEVHREIQQHHERTASISSSLSVSGSGVQVGGLPLISRFGTSVLAGGGNGDNYNRRAAQRIESKSMQASWSSSRDDGGVIGTGSRTTKNSNTTSKTISVTGRRAGGGLVDDVYVSQQQSLSTEAPTTTSSTLASTSSEFQQQLQQQQQQQHLLGVTRHPLERGPFVSSGEGGERGRVHLRQQRAPPPSILYEVVDHTAALVPPPRHQQQKHVTSFPNHYYYSNSSAKQGLLETNNTATVMNRMRPNINERMIATSAARTSNTAPAPDESSASVPLLLQQNDDTDIDTTNNHIQQHGITQDDGATSQVYNYYGYRNNNEAHLLQQQEQGENQKKHSPSSTGGALDYVMLGQFKRRPPQNEQEAEGWGAVPDLDIFFGSVYNYYYHRGLTHIVGKGFVQILSLFFTLGLSVFLFAYVDWSALMTCKDEESCRDTIGAYIKEKPFSTTNIWNFLLFLYCILFTGYGILSMFTLYNNVKFALLARTFYRDKLGISTRKLEGGAVEWDDIVQKILKLQRSGEYRIAIHGEGINELIVSQRILRKENFMIALVNCGLFDLRLPCPWPLSKEGCTKVHYLCMSVEWSLHVCLLNFMFNHKYQIRPAFYSDPAALRRRIVFCGIAHALFMPFLLFFMTLHFFLVNMYVWRSSNEYLGPREWSPFAKWRFREFNELPHAFDRRMGPSYKAGDDFLKLFTQSPMISYFGRIVVFFSGSLVAVLLGLAALNDAILLHVKLSQWNLLWYVGMLGITFSIGKGMLPDEKVHPPYAYNLFAEMDAALTKVAVYTHYFPDIWKKRGWKKETQQSFSALFRSKSQLFVAELAATLLAPFVLCFRLSSCAEEICSFVHRTKMEVPGAGDVCGYSCFDFDSFEDEQWEGRQLRGHQTLSKPDDALYYQPRFDRPRTKEGKMEKSFFSFKAAHPNWKCNPSGQNLIERLERYKHMEALALARERQHHINASARQLEQLRVDCSADSCDTSAQLFDADQLDEAYITEPNYATDVSGEPPYSIGMPQRIRDSQLRGGSSPVVDSRGPFQPSQQQSEAITHRPSLQHHNPRRSVATQSFSSRLPGDSVLHYTDMGLSEELRVLLNRSSLDPGISIAGLSLGGTADPVMWASQLRNLSRENMSSYHASFLGVGGESVTRESAEEQYLRLERYHSQLREQRQDTIHEDTALPMSVDDDQ